MLQKSRLKTFGANQLNSLSHFITYNFHVPENIRFIISKKHNDLYESSFIIGYAFNVINIHIAKSELQFFG